MVMSSESAGPRVSGRRLGPSRPLIPQMLPPEGVARAQDFVDMSMKDLDDESARHQLVYENGRRFVPETATHRLDK